MRTLSPSQLEKSKARSVRVGQTGTVIPYRHTTAHNVIAVCGHADGSGCAVGLLTLLKPAIGSCDGQAAAVKELKKDTWLKITGILEKTNYNGNEIMKIHASKIEKIPAPNSPYTYPDFDYFEKSS